MITVALSTGTLRAEGYPVTLRGWERYGFFVHHADRRGETDDTRWIVSEARSGYAVGEGDCASDTEAIAAAQSFLDRKKRWWAEHLLRRAIARSPVRAANEMVCA